MYWWCLFARAKSAPQLVVCKMVAHHSHGTKHHQLYRQHAEGGQGRLHCITIRHRSVRRIDWFCFTVLAARTIASRGDLSCNKVAIIGHTHVCMCCFLYSSIRPLHHQCVQLNSESILCAGSVRVVVAEGHVDDASSTCNDAVFRNLLISLSLYCLERRHRLW